MSTELTIAASAVSYITSAGNDYIANTEGRGTFVITNAFPALVGQNFADSCYQTFLSWDTSSLPDNAIIREVRIQFNLNTDLSTTDFLVRAAVYDYGASVTSADWRQPNQLAALPLVGLFDTESLGATGLDYVFLGNQLLIDTMNLTGSVKLILFSDRLMNQNDPSGNEHIFLDDCDLVIIYDTPVTEKAGTRKTYEYKIYDREQNFLGFLSKINSEFTYAQEINTAGSEAVIELGREAGDFTNIDVGYKVEVYCYDRQTPNGALIYTGRVLRYSDKHGDEQNVKIVLSSYGEEFSRSVLEDITGETTDLSQTSTTSYYDLLSTGVIWLAQSIQPTTTPFVSLRVNFGVFQNSTTFDIYSDSDGNLGALLASRTLTSTGVGGLQTVNFSPAVDLIPGNTYWIVAKSLYNPKGFRSTLGYSNANPYANGKLRVSGDSGASWSDVATSDMYFVTNTGTFSTEITYTEKDPALILKDILDKYAASGGSIGYYYSGLEITDTKVTYTFKNSTILEAINTVLKFCPFRWYWYVDQANNRIYLKQRELERSLTLSFGKNIQSMEPIRILDNLCNAVYFTGGEVSPGVNFYEKFVNQSSVNFYGGIRAMAISDNRVTLSGTAEKFANRLLEANIAPELRTTVALIDSDPVLNDRGIDLEALPLGSIAGFANVEGVPPLWDVAEWDVAYWDYNLKQLGSINMQIVRIEYAPGLAIISMSSIPQDIVKLIDEALVEIDKIKTVNNPASPT